MFSIIMPIDTNRLEQFKRTKQVYDSFPYTKEFILPTRSLGKIASYLHNNDLMKDVRIIPYKHERGFNPSKALNIGVRKAKYEQVIITSPEVMPLTPVLEQLTELKGQNVVCQVVDQAENGENAQVLVSKGFRDDTPAMYFLAMFQKKDIEAINGWDEQFMDGYAYEDNDFGDRWKRAELPFVIRDDIRAIHQYHPRSETIKGGAATNFQHYCNNNDRGVIRPAKGMYQGVL